MKAFLLLFFSIICMHSNAQDIPKGANTIIVKGVSFDTVVNHLLDEGFAIHTIDKDYKIVETEYKHLFTGSVPEIMFFVRVKDSVATINGKWKTRDILNLETTNGNEYLFDITSEKAPVPKRSFQAMNEFALSLHGEISYQKL